MQSTRDIKRRIKSVKNTQQITKAMKMVAAAKLRRTQSNVIHARPYRQRITEAVATICSSPLDFDHLLLKRGQGDRKAMVVVSADRGLCGGYNSNLIKYATNLAEEQGISDVILVGNKPLSVFKRKNLRMIGEFYETPDYPDYRYAKDISKAVIDAFETGEYSEIQLVYTEFVSTITQRPDSFVLIPVEPPGREAHTTNEEFIFEPDVESVLNRLLPQYVETMVHECLLESKASEFGAKMTAMSSATDNADKMIDSLTLSYNQARQAAITKELTEIVGGAEALK